MAIPGPLASSTSMGAGFESVIERKSRGGAPPFKEQCVRGHDYAQTRARRRSNGTTFCRECLKIRQTQYEQSKPGEKFVRSKKSTIKRNYGLTLEQYGQILEDAGSICPICQGEMHGKPGTPSGACLDHCHATGVVRGALCGKCNTAIGYLRDDPEAMERAAAWVREGGNVNCRRRGAPGADSQVNKNPSKPGNTVEQGDGKKGMEYKPVVRKPYWDGSPDVLKGE